MKFPRYDPEKTIATNAADFVCKYGKDIYSGIYIYANINMFLIHPFMHPESFNFLRNEMAAPVQLMANYWQVKDKPEKAYDFATVGSTCHTLACAGEGLYFNTLTWAFFAQASYKASHWPQRLKNFSLSMKENQPPVLAKMDETLDHIARSQPVQKISAGFSALKEKVLPRKNMLGDFIDNKMDLLKSPHARAGTIAFIASVGQWIEAAATHSEKLSPFTPLWFVAGCVYMAHGLLTAAREKRKPAEIPTP